MLMRLFVLVWLSIYATPHLYLFWKIRLAYPRWRFRAFLLIVFFLFMIVSPKLVLALDRRGHFWPAYWIALIAYRWMGVVLLFFFFGLLSDVWNVAAKGVSYFRPSARSLVLPQKRILAAVVALTACMSLLGLWEASHVRLRKFVLRTASLPAGSAPIRIALVADVHLGLTVGEGQLRRIVKIVRKADPDVVVSTGDLVDASFYALKSEVDLLADLKPPLGKFAALGNHEHYAGLEKSLAFLRAAGFRPLRGEAVGGGDRLRIVGIDDPAGHAGRKGLLAQEKTLLSDHAVPRLPTIILKHRPVVETDSLGLFDLQISGHTHGGQVLPFGFFVWLRYPVWAKMYRFDGGSAFYPSRGAGTWGPPMRLFAPPEVVLFVLEPMPFLETAPSLRAASSLEATLLPELALSEVGSR